MRMNREVVLKVGKVGFPLALFVVAIYEISHFVRTLDVQLLQQEIGKLQFTEFLLILIIAFLAISPMLLYDVILAHILKLDVPQKKLIRNSFITNSFSNLIGFGGLVGMMLRTSFYTQYKEATRSLLGTIASVTFYFLTGLSFLSLVVLGFYHDSRLLAEAKWLFLAVAGLGLYMPLFFMIHLLQKLKGKQTPISFRSGAALLGTSVLEWLCAFLVIYSTAFFLKIPLHFNDLFPVFIIASCAGAASMIPGGLGSFDLVFIWGMQSLVASDEKVLALIIIYRIGYFVLPFILSTVLFIKEYWEKWNQSWNQLPNLLMQKGSHILLTILVFVSGLILLLSASVPGIIGRLKLAQEILSSPIMNVSHQLSVTTGFLLLGLSRGIEYRVKWVYHITLVVLSFAIVFTLFKGIDYEEATFLLIAALLLKTAKSQFYRENYVLTWGKSIFDITLILLITFLYLFIGYVNLPSSKINIPSKLMPYVLMNSHDVFFSAMIGLVTALLILAIFYVVSKPLHWKDASSRGQEKRILDHLQQYGGSTLAHLIFLHDKYVFWNQKETVLFSYQKYANKMVVLGNPIGEKEDLIDAIEELAEKADLYGYTPVYYEVSQSLLPSFHENGYDFFKLGEEGFVNLESFSMEGSKRKNARTLLNKYAREDIHFEVVHPPFSDDFLKELEDVSLQWLNNRKEKGFSLGYFDKHYLNQSDIALVRGKESQVLGFASLIPVYDGRQTLSVDLMRFIPAAPKGVMDFIFLSLFLWSKEQGYKRFNMGMAPLSNVGMSKFSFLSEKIASQIFEHGQSFYQFQGLRRFKDKYANHWEPKYLAYRRQSSLLFTMMQITFLISRKQKGSASLFPPLSRRR